MTLVGGSRVMRRPVDPELSQATGTIPVRRGARVSLGQRIDEARAVRPHGGVMVADRA